MDQAALPPVDASTRHAAPLFAVPVHKFVLLTLCTFGGYQFYWTYVNWIRIARREGLVVSPFWRTALAGLWNFELLPNISRAAEAERVVVSWHPTTLAVLYLITNIAWQLPDPWSWLGLLAPLPLVPVVATVAALPSSRGHVAGYSGWNVLAIVLGVPLLALALYLEFFAPSWLEL